MSYIGAKELKASDIRRFDVTSSTSATHTLTWTAPNEQSLIVTINGVKQQEDAYSVSGVTLTLTSALVSTDKLEVIGINDIGTTITPAQNSVDADKLSSSVNAEIAANTAKVTNATHTGDVTGATALTIAADAVDIAMLSATGTASATTFLRGDNAWASAGGDNTPRFQAFLSVDQNPANSTWVKVQFNGELYDTDGAYDTSTYRFTVPADEGGTYFFYSTVTLGDQSTGAPSYTQIVFYKNGATLSNGPRALFNSGAVVYQTAHSIQTILTLVPTDYIEIYGQITTPTSNARYRAEYCSFGGYKLL